jgi:hypothetical protein
MELHELHVSELYSCAVGYRVAVTGRDLRVSRIPVHLAASAGCENRRVGDDLDWLPGTSPSDSAADSVAHDEVENAGLLQHLDLSGGPHTLDQSSRDLGSGLVPVRMDDSAPGMRGFLSKLELPTGLEIEIRSSGVQLAHPRRAFLDEHLNSFGVAEGGPCRQRVLSMELRRISCAKRRCNASLGICGRAVEQ